MKINNFQANQILEKYKTISKPVSHFAPVLLKYKDDSWELIITETMCGLLVWGNAFIDNLGAEEIYYLDAHIKIILGSSLKELL